MDTAQLPMPSARTGNSVRRSAGFSLVHDGKLVVDLTGGTADDSGRAYDAETLQLVFSSTKGVAAICLAMLVQAGELDYDGGELDLAWFGAAGKADLPISWAISHRAGLASVDNPPPLEEVLAVTPIVEAIAAQVPLWELDGSHGYHAITYGWIAAEILRRVTGIRMNDWLQTNVVEPLGVEFHMGLPESEHTRVAPIRNSSFVDRSRAVRLDDVAHRAGNDGRSGVIA